tara:strand:+ start:447 stop:1397 length:951 start_codon:yes stop_codon:yes gene_type:complete
MKKKILIFGGSGFVGLNLSKYLAKKNYDVISTYNSKKPKNIKNVRFVKFDLMSNHFDIKIFRNVHSVFVCSANSSGAKIMTNNPASHFEDNLRMNLNLVKNLQFSKIKKIIFFSSSTVYPNIRKSCNEKTVNYSFFEKYNFIGNGKLMIEKMYELYTSEFKRKIDLLIIRPSNIYGPHDKFDKEKSKVIPSIIRKSLESKKTLKVWGDGSDIKDFIYIDDFINLTYKLFKIKKKFLIVNVSSSKPVLLRNIIKIIRDISNPKLKIRYTNSKFRMIPVRKVSNELLKKIIKFKLQYTMERGLQNTIEWYKKNSNDSK